VPDSTSDSLSDLLARGERAAFHGPPSAAIPLLEQAVVEARGRGRDAEAALAAWLLGVCLSASGRWGSALAVLRPLHLDPAAASTGSASPERRLVASLAASTAATVERQLGRAGEARLLDEAALALAGGSEEARFDATVGLAVDAAGQSRIEAARTLLTDAEALIGARSDWWRQRVRLDWARAEVASAADDPEGAYRLASAALTRAEAAGAPRHVAKSLLLMGVAQVGRGDLVDAVATLRRCVTLADPLGLLPVLRPAWSLLAALAPAVPDAGAEVSRRALTQARSTIGALAEDLPDAEPDRLRSTWLARDDIAALLLPPPAPR
jgi:hypothetical protein